MDAKEDPVLDVKVALESEILKHKQFWDRAKLVDVVLDGKWLFDAAYSYEIYNTFQKDNKTLVYMYDHLTQFEQYCPEWELKNSEGNPYLTRENNKVVPSQITLKDVINVFSETNEWKRALSLLEAQWLYRRSIQRTSNDAFQRSCKWVLWCSSPLTQSDMDQQPPWNAEPITSSQATACVAEISNLYSWYWSQSESHLTYDEDRDREIYRNWIVEEDRWQFCDVNALLEKIHKTISCDVEDSPKYSSYDPQNVPKTIWDNVILPEKHDNPPSNLPDPDDSPLKRVNEHIPTEWVSAEEPEEEADYLLSLKNGEPRIWPNTTAQDLWNSARLAVKPKEWNLSSLTSPGNAWSDRIDASTLLQNYQCNDTSLWAEDLPVDMYEEWTKLAETLNTYIWQLDIDDRDRVATWHPDSRTSREQETSRVDDPRLAKAELEELVANFEMRKKLDSPDVQELINQTEDDLKSCIKEHTDEEVEWVWKFVKKKYWTASKVAECLAKVLCTDISDPTWLWIYRVKLCSVPSREYRTANVIPSMCISDSLDALASVAAKIDDGWRNVRHVYAKEFLEFQAFWLDYASRFVFTLNTNFRSPRTTKNPKNKKMELVSKVEDIGSLVLHEETDKNIIRPYKTQVKLENTYITEAENLDAQYWVDLSSEFLKVQDMLASQKVTVPQVKLQLKNEMNLEQNTHLTRVYTDHYAFRSEILTISDTIREDITGQYQKLKN